MLKRCRSVTNRKVVVLPPVCVPALRLFQRSGALELSALVSACLQVESALVLQPSPVAGHAANLLAVVVWRWVGEGRDGRIDAVTLDAVEKGRVFLRGC